MNKLIEELMKGVATLFFQEGYSRTGDTKNLDYWATNDRRGVYIHLNGLTKEYPVGILEDCRLSISKVDDEYTVKVVRIFDDQDSDYYEEKTLGYIPIDPSSLCWEEFPNCVSIIYYLLTK